MNGNKEQIRNGPEDGIEVQKPTTEQIEKLMVTPEAAVELSPRDAETLTEKARLEALDTAKSAESISNKEKTKNHSETSRRGSIGKKQLDKSYTQTMRQIQTELPVNSRTFSKIIHNKFVEKTSDVIGGTIARPNAILAGAFFAFILTLLTYTVAKTIGYTLSGFETIAAFIIGWIIGITYDYLRILFTGKT